MISSILHDEIYSLSVKLLDVCYRPSLFIIIIIIIIIVLTIMMVLVVMTIKTSVYHFFLHCRYYNDHDRDDFDGDDDDDYGDDYNDGVKGDDHKDICSSFFLALYVLHDHNDIDDDGCGGGGVVYAANTC